MNYLPLFLALIFCSPNEEKYKKRLDEKLKNIPYSTVEVEGCKFIFWNQVYISAVAHHPGCTNPIHKCGSDK